MQDKNENVVDRIIGKMLGNTLCYTSLLKSEAELTKLSLWQQYIINTYVLHLTMRQHKSRHSKSPPTTAPTTIPITTKHYVQHCTVGTDNLLLKNLCATLHCGYS